MPSLSHRDQKCAEGLRRRNKELLRELFTMDVLILVLHIELLVIEFLNFYEKQTALSSLD